MNIVDNNRLVKVTSKVSLKPKLQALYNVAREESRNMELARTGGLPQSLFVRASEIPSNMKYHAQRITMVYREGLSTALSIQ